jgi:hypothetical protein
MLDILQYVAAFINVAFGLWTLVQPEVVARASSFSLLGERGVAEMRTAFGGYFIGMGVAIVLLNNPEASAAIGIAWLGAAAVRLVTLFIQDRTAITDTSFFVIWASEIFTGAILVAQIA